MEMAKGRRNEGRQLPVEWKMKLLTYVVVCSFLAVVNYITSPYYWWVLWVIAGWGLNLALGLVAWYYVEKEKEDER